jgi:lysophospholipase L1-like esterase
MGWGMPCVVFKTMVMSGLGVILAAANGYAMEGAIAEACQQPVGCRSCKPSMADMLRPIQRDSTSQVCEKTMLSALTNDSAIFPLSSTGEGPSPSLARPVMPASSEPVRNARGMPQYPGQNYLIRPRTGGQLYVQRLAAVQAGQLFSQILPHTFVNEWQTASQQPTYQQWLHLLEREATLLAVRQGNRPLNVLVGDSLYLWLPSEHLAADRLWLNQSISGETTSHILRRLAYFATAQPDDIYIMAGVNDLKNGVEPPVVVSNIELIAQRLREQHPRSRIVVLSILPTRLPPISSTTVRWVNQRVAMAVNQQGVEFVDLQPAFMDSQGLLRTELTTDGIHLSPQGYRVLAGHLNTTP